MVTLKLSVSVKQCNHQITPQVTKTSLIRLQKRVCQTDSILTRKARSAGLSVYCPLVDFSHFSGKKGSWKTSVLQKRNVKEIFNLLFLAHYFPNVCILFLFTVDVELLLFPIIYPTMGSHPSNPLIGCVVLVSEEHQCWSISQWSPGECHKYTTHNKLRILLAPICKAHYTVRSLCGKHKMSCVHHLNTIAS